MGVRMMLPTIMTAMSVKARTMVKREVLWKGAGTGRCGTLWWTRKAEIVNWW